MPLDLTKSTINTSGGVRGRFHFQKGQDHFRIPAATIEELAERGFIVLDKSDLVDAVSQLLLNEGGRLQALIEALDIPRISTDSDNSMVQDETGAWKVVRVASTAEKTVSQTQSSSGANLVFTWATPFADTDYSVSFTPISPAASGWSFSIVNKSLTRLEISLDGIAVATTFQLVAKGK